MSVRSNQSAIDLGVKDEVTSPHDLGEGAPGFPSQDPSNPLTRKISIQIRKSLAELINNEKAGTWKLPVPALNDIFKQNRFTKLSGEVEAVGDLKSAVLHTMDATTVKSTFPIQLGVKISGVDATTYSSIGVPFSMIAAADSVSNIPIELQKDDVSVAYSFAKQYPGYTANNLRTLNVTPVANRQMMLVDKGHPIVTAIKENSESLQAANITESPEQLVKISETLFNTLMKPVEQQVKSQIKFSDLTQFGVSISPADYPSWAVAGEALTKEALAPIKAKHKRHILKVKGDPQKLKELEQQYADELDDAQANIATQPLEFCVQLNVAYNFM